MIAEQFRACDLSLLYDWLMARYQPRIIIIIIIIVIIINIIIAMARHIVSGTGYFFVRKPDFPSVALFVDLSNSNGYEQNSLRQRLGAEWSHPPVATWKSSATSQATPDPIGNHWRTAGKKTSDLATPEVGQIVIWTPMPDVCLVDWSWVTYGPLRTWMGEFKHTWRALSRWSL